MERFIYINLNGKRVELFAEITAIEPKMISFNIPEDVYEKISKGLFLAGAHASRLKYSGKWYVIYRGEIEVMF